MAIHCCIGQDVVEDHSCCIATATTMKTRQTYSAIGSDRQAIIERPMQALFLFATSGQKFDYLTHDTFDIIRFNMHAFALFFVIYQK